MRRRYTCSEGYKGADYAKTPCNQFGECRCQRMESDAPHCYWCGFIDAAHELEAAAIDRFKIEMPSEDGVGLLVRALTKWAQQNYGTLPVVKAIKTEGRVVLISISSDKTVAFQSFMTRRFAGFRWASLQ